MWLEAQRVIKSRVWRVWRGHDFGEDTSLAAGSFHQAPALFRLLILDRAFIAIAAFLPDSLKFRVCAGFVIGFFLRFEDGEWSLICFSWYLGTWYADVKNPCSGL